MVGVASQCVQNVLYNTPRHKSVINPKITTAVELIIMLTSCF